MAAAAAGPAIAAVVNVIGDYIKSLKEPPEEVVRAFRRLEQFIDTYNDRIQELGPIPWKDDDAPGRWGGSEI